MDSQVVSGFIKSVVREIAALVRILQDLPENGLLARFLEVNLIFARILQVNTFLARSFQAMHFL